MLTSYCTAAFLRNTSCVVLLPMFALGYLDMYMYHAMQAATVGTVYGKYRVGR